MRVRFPRIVLGAAACSLLSGTALGDEIDAHVVALADGKPSVVVAAAGRLGEAGTDAARAVPPLIEVARHGESPEARAAAVTALDRIGTAALPKWIDFLEEMKLLPLAGEWGKAFHQVAMLGPAVHPKDLATAFRFPRSTRGSKTQLLMARRSAILVSALAPLRPAEDVFCYVRVEARSTEPARRAAADVALAWTGRRVARSLDASLGPVRPSAEDVGRLATLYGKASQLVLSAAGWILQEVEAAPALRKAAASLQRTTVWLPAHGGRHATLDLLIRWGDDAGVRSAFTLRPKREGDEQVFRQLAERATQHLLEHGKEIELPDGSPEWLTATVREARDGRRREAERTRKAAARALEQLDKAGVSPDDRLGAVEALLEAGESREQILHALVKLVVEHAHGEQEWDVDQAVWLLGNHFPGDPRTLPAVRALYGLDASGGAPQEPSCHPSEAARALLHFAELDEGLVEAGARFGGQHVPVFLARKGAAAKEPIADMAAKLAAWEAHAAAENPDDIDFEEAWWVRLWQQREHALRAVAALGPAGADQADRVKPFTGHADPLLAHLARVAQRRIAK